MKTTRLFAAAAGTLLLAACATAPHTRSKTAAVTPAEIEPCLIQAMDMMTGTWEYTGVIARISGAYRTYETRSVHGKSGDDTWTSQSFGGDAVEDDSISYERVRGNQIFGVEDGVEMIEGARTFLSCDGPNDVGRITATAKYVLPLDEEGTELLYVDNIANFSEGGSYYSEEIRNEAGEVVAWRSGVTVPAEDTAASG